MMFLDPTLFPSNDIDQVGMFSASGHFPSYEIDDDVWLPDGNLYQIDPDIHFQ
jgi:hypothetical protein